MGVYVEPGALFLDQTIAKARNVLRAYAKGTPTHEIHSVSGVDLLPTEVSAVLGELRARGLIAKDREVTPEGEVLMRAEARKRTPSAKAQKVFDGFLDRLIAASKHPDFPYEIESVWVFGSLAKGSEDVGDIDFAVDFTRRWNGIKDRMMISKKAKLHGWNYVSSISWVENAEHFLYRKLVHGAKRPAILKEASIGELVRLGFPCREAWNAK